jgi:hypothetical protein
MTRRSSSVMLSRSGSSSRSTVLRPGRYRLTFCLPDRKQPARNGGRERTRRQNEDPTVAHKEGRASQRSKDGEATQQGAHGDHGPQQDCSAGDLPSSIRKCESEHDSGGRSEYAKEHQRVAAHAEHVRQRQEDDGQEQRTRVRVGNAPPAVPEEFSHDVIPS